MPQDWDALVLAPLEAIFGEGDTPDPTAPPPDPPMFTPAASQPGAPAYAIDGVFDRAYLAMVLLDDKSVASALKPVMGVRLARFTVLPQQNDLLFVPSVGLNYIVREVEADGHGWAKLMLNRVA